MGVLIVEVSSNLFQFKFKSEFDLDRVYSGGPWSFDNQVLMLQRWQLGMTAANVKFESVALWVVAEIGSKLGEVVEVERRKSQGTQNFFMRVKVALPTAKPLRRGAFLRGLDRQRTLLGHDTRHCAKFFALKKDRNKGACQYGDWLKANGGRNRSPLRKKPVEQGH
ncbi:hypothetical protein CFP56_011134 [Quercus suber]|uniref:DUF4283 domain-containing protein n=1 Tax=Quercus suber TaxID=58331 RepID=A0AAW0KX54_QUESU